MSRDRLDYIKARDEAGEISHHRINKMLFEEAYALVEENDRLRVTIRALETQLIQLKAMLRKRT